jgi:[ribosomal protein S5]-alanine N-acetyltransferase
VSEPGPRIRTDRLLLRRLVDEDIDEWLRVIFSDPVVTRYLPPQGRPVPREDVVAHLERNRTHWDEFGYGVWAVCDGDTGDLIGQCGLRFLEEFEDVEVLYAFGKALWGRGLATEACRAAMRFGFEGWSFPRIIGLVVPENVASRKVLEKMDMELDGEADAFGLHLVRYMVARDGFDPGAGRYEVG